MEQDDLRPRGAVEVTCSKPDCGWSFWVGALDSRLPDGPFLCPSCLLEAEAPVLAGEIMGRPKAMAIRRYSGEVPDGPPGSSMRGMLSAALRAAPGYRADVTDAPGYVDVEMVGLGWRRLVPAFLRRPFVRPRVEEALLRNVAVGVRVTVVVR